MINKGKSFWCERWHQQVYERLCMHRYKAGLKRCENCGKGYELLAAEIAQRRREAKQLSIDN